MATIYVDEMGNARRAGESLRLPPPQSNVPGRALVVVPQPPGPPPPPPPPAAPAATPAAPQPGIRRALATAGNTLRSASPALVGGAIGAVADRALAPDASGPVTPAVPGRAEIPVDPNLRGPAPQAPSFFRDTETGRNLYNAANALTGVMPAVSGILRAGSNTARAFEGAMAVPVGVRAAQAAPAAVNAAQAGNAPAPTPTPPNLDGKIIRDGNSYSGKNVQFGADIVNPDGSLRRGGFGVTSIDTSAGYRADLAQLARNRAERESAGPSIAPFNVPSTTFAQDLRAKTDAGRVPEGLSKRQEAAFLQREQDRAQERELATMRINEGLRMNELNNETTRRGQDIGAAVSDRELQTKAALAATSRADRERQAKLEADRFELDKRKFGLEVAKEKQTQRAARETQVQKNLESIFVNTDNEVDKAAAAEARRGLDRSVARLGGQGLQDLSPLDEQRLLAGVQLLKSMRENAGWLPWQPDALKTIDPVDLTNMKVMPNGDRVITRSDSKAAGQIIPRRFFGTEEGVRWFGGTPTNRYDILSEPQR